jgi:hypothetical protein
MIMTTNATNIITVLISLLLIGLMYRKYTPSALHLSRALYLPIAMVGLSLCTEHCQKSERARLQGILWNIPATGCVCTLAGSSWPRVLRSGVPAESPGTVPPQVPTLYWGPI